MSKYRFKTKQEFIKANHWDDRWNLPDGWSEKMRRFIGKNISDEFIKDIEDGDLEIDGYNFYTEDIIENKPTSETHERTTSTYILIRRKHGNKI